MDERWIEMSEDGVLAPGQVRFNCEDAVETTFAEHGSKGLQPGAPDVAWKFPTVRLRRDVGRITSRRDLDTKPGFRMALALAKQIESVGEVALSSLKADKDVVNALARPVGTDGEVETTIADFIYLLLWRAWERFGDAWQYPNSFSCQGCDDLISGAEVDLTKIAVFKPAAAGGTVVYRLRHPWQRTSTEKIVQVEMGTPKFGASFVNCSKTEWDEEDDWAMRVREVSSSFRKLWVVDADGVETVIKPKLIAHQSLDLMHEIDLSAMSRFVGDLRICGGTGRVMTYTHKKCGGESLLQLNWRTDFLESPGG